MGVPYRNCCPSCGSFAVTQEGETCICAKCGHKGETRVFRKQHPSRNTGIVTDSTSVPRFNKRRQKGQRRIWKPGRDE